MVNEDVKYVLHSTHITKYVPVLLTIYYYEQLLSDNPLIIISVMKLHTFQNM
jgi:hypothetical protein